jgi:hypothetical protein
MSDVLNVFNPPQGGDNVLEIGGTLQLDAGHAISGSPAVNGTIKVTGTQTTGLDLSAATLTNQIVFSNGVKLTVSGNTVTFTSADGTKSASLTLA